MNRFDKMNSRIGWYRCSLTDFLYVHEIFIGKNGKELTKYCTQYIGVGESTRNMPKPNLQFVATVDYDTIIKAGYKKHE